MTLSTSLQIRTFQAASHLTDPICKAREQYYMASLTEALYPTTSKIECLARRSFCYLRSFFWGCLALGTTLPGMALRCAAIHMQERPYIYKTGLVQEQEAGKELSFFSWNVCCIEAGYCISDGGVMPGREREDAICAKIQEVNADVVSLYEVADIQTALRFYAELTNRYAHFYFHMGPRTLGVSSEMFVASKVRLDNPSFEVFPKDMLVGRTKNAEKGIFSFDVGRLHCYATHLQNSEPDHADEELVREARAREMDFILERMRDPALLMGDLNLDDAERKASGWNERFSQGELDLKGRVTWGGDEFCAGLLHQTVVTERNLDYVLGYGAVELKTELVASGFDGKVFRREALSDHAGLLSRVQLTANQCIAA